MTSTNAKRRLQAAGLFAHFRANYQDELPEDEEFDSQDYYLFECIVRKPWLKNQFGIGVDSMVMPDESELAIFEWVFKLKRPRKADDNENVFYRSENVLLWEKMKRYDERESTTFADRFDISDPSSAPRMHEVEAEYLSHKARRAPSQVMEELLRQLVDIKADTLIDQADHLRPKLIEIQKCAGKFIKAIDAS